MSKFSNKKEVYYMDNDLTVEEKAYYRKWFLPMIKQGKNYHDISVAASMGGYRNITRRDLDGFLFVQQERNKNKI